MCSHSKILTKRILISDKVQPNNLEQLGQEEKKSFEKECRIILKTVHVTARINANKHHFYEGLWLLVNCTNGTVLTLALS